MKTSQSTLLCLLTLSSTLSACGRTMGPDQQGHMINMPFGGLFMILVLIAIVGFMVMILKGVTRGDQTDDDPLEILKRRYASGEIDKDEYERMKKDLRDD